MLKFFLLVVGVFLLVSTHQWLLGGICLFLSLILNDPDDEDEEEDDEDEEGDESVNEE